MDVYRRKLRAWDSFLDYSLFLTFFPHLVAGPIVRANDFLPQLRTPRQATADQVGWGFALLVISLFEKMILADKLFRPVVDQVYADAQYAGFVDGWVGTLAFAAQILFDFSGYSTCAIGLALCLGFSLKDNFRFPYASVGFTDFWRRWHISLSTWLRDYLYIPLGGNRAGPWRTHVNLMITMLLGGLWHGASWRFVVWGAMHGLFLVVERIYRQRWIPTPQVVVGQANLARVENARAGRGGIVAWLGPIIGMLITFALVNLTWVFFRAETFTAAFQLSMRMVGWPAPTGAANLVGRSTILLVLGFTALMLTAQWWVRDSSLEAVAARLPRWVRSVALAVMVFLLAITFGTGDDNAFIYFQF